MKKENKIEKVQEDKYHDFYIRIRGKIFKWLNQGKIAKLQGNGWMNCFAGYLVLLPDLVHLLIKLLTDRQLPLKYRSMLIVIFGYLLSPIDLIPDFIPVIGFIDDLLIVIIFLNKIINSSSPVLIEKIKFYWAGQDDILVRVGEIMALLNKYTARIPRLIANYMEDSKK